MYETEPSFYSDRSFKYLTHSKKDEVNEDCEGGNSQNSDHINEYSYNERQLGNASMGHTENATQAPIRSKTPMYEVLKINQFLNHNEIKIGKSMCSTPRDSVSNSRPSKAQHISKKRYREK